jgi:hypothetical protein
MTDNTLLELEIPDGIHDADEAVEVLRAWIADGALHVIFHPDSFGSEISEWGRLLADVAQHIARAASLQGEMSDAEALRVIQAAFEHGTQGPAPERTGHIKGRTQH